jgi:hypothetical protein
MLDFEHCRPYIKVTKSRVQTKVFEWIFTGSSEAHSGNAFAMSSCNASQAGFVMRHRLVTEIVPPDHLLLDSAPNIGPLIPRWKLDKFKNC